TSFLLFSSFSNPRALHSFPTRRSSDLHADMPLERAWSAAVHAVTELPAAGSIAIIVQREFSEPVTLAFVEETVASKAHCLGLHRSEEHTSELQSRENLVCRLLLEKKKQ